MKILSAHQPNYLPYLGFFHKLMIADQFVILDDVQFEKNSFIPRNRIKTANGETWLTIPLKMEGHMTKKINEMEIAHDLWQEKHFKSLYLAYKKAPYYRKYFDILEAYYKSSWKMLTDWNMTMLFFLMNELEIKTPVIFQSILETQEKGQDLIIELCKKFHCSMFVFGCQGRDYVDVEYMMSIGIVPYIQDYKHPTYNQLWGEFKPNMCILDLLFNEGAEKTREIIMHGNATKEEI